MIDDNNSNSSGRLPRTSTRLSNIYAVSTSVDLNKDKSTNKFMDKFTDIFEKCINYKFLFGETTGMIIGIEARKSTLLSLIQTCVLIPLHIIIIIQVGIYWAPNIMYPSIKNSIYIMIYALLFCIGQIFHISLIRNAALTKNTVQVIFTFIFDLLLLVYTIVQAVTIWFLNIEVENKELMDNLLIVIDEFKILSIIIIILDSIFVTLSAISSFNVYKEYGWAMYTINGASIQKRTMLKKYHAFSVLLKVCIFFNTGIILIIVYTLIVDLVDPSTTNTSLQTGSNWGFIIIISFITIAYYFTGLAVVLRGKKWAMILFPLLIIINSFCWTVSLYIIYFLPRFRFVFVIIAFFISTTVVLNLVVLIVSLTCLQYNREDFEALIFNQMQFINGDQIPTNRSAWALD